jgi:hypothetical protein
MKSLINNEGQRDITSSALSGFPNSTDQSSPSTLTSKGLELIDAGRAPGQFLLHNEI